MRTLAIRATAGALLCAVAIIAGGTGVAAAGASSGAGGTDPNDIRAR